jgi:hypothetical protein
MLIPKCPSIKKKKQKRIKAYYPNTKKVKREMN